MRPVSENAFVRASTKSRAHMRPNNAIDRTPSESPRRFAVASVDGAGPRKQFGGRASCASTMDSVLEMLK